MANRWVLIALMAVCSKADPKPVDDLDVPSYLGRWYQVYASATVKYTMEVGANCVIADYGSYGDRKDEITVTNTVHPFGHKVEVKGYAVADPAKAGVFQVALGPPGKGADPAAAKPFAKSNYIVAGLGPLVNGKYDYAIVTDPGKISLYILARDVSRFKKQYDSDVLQKVKEMGFTHFWNMPLNSNQMGCTYSETSEILV